MRLNQALVTGANGFVGAHLVRCLLREGISVRALVRAEADVSSLEGLDIELVRGDLLDVERLGPWMGGCDACFHLAAAYRAPSEDELRRINVDGTRAVLEAARHAGLSVVVHASTMGTLAKARGRGLLRENDSHLPDTASPYVRTKFEAERVAEEFAREGLPVRIALLAAPVGAWDRVPTVTGQRILAVLRGETPSYIQGAINHVPARDVADWLLQAARIGDPGERFLLAHPRGNLSRRRLVRKVCKAADMPVPPLRPLRLLLAKLRRFRRGEVVGGPASLACDPLWTLTRLDVTPTRLTTAFREAVAWFRENGKVS